MKKNYVKPCSSCIVMTVELPMLKDSFGANNQNLDRAPHTTIGSSMPSTPSSGGNAKENPFDYDEE